MTPLHKKGILIHTCCAACASYLVRELEKENFQIAMFFYNPNLGDSEFEIRLNSLKILSCQLGLLLFTPKLQPKEYSTLVAPYCDKNSIKYIADPERRNRKCRDILINLLLERAAKAAEDADCHFFTTSMLCSPYRDHNTIWDCGQKISETGKADFLYQDFRKGYWMGRNFARKHDLAIPAFCSDYLQ